MGRLSLENKSELYKIKEMRLKIKKLIDRGLITENTILYFSKLQSPDVSLSDKKNSYNRNIYLNQIFTSPFLLCDQEGLDRNIKVILPILLEYRYNYEVEELDLQYKYGYITLNEYEKMKKNLYFAYYLSSEDGKNIIKNGKAKGICRNVLTKTK